MRSGGGGRRDAPSCAAAEALEPEQAAGYVYLAKRSMFERRAGETALADEYEQQALAKLVEPAPVWLALAIESIRFRMTKTIQTGYQRLWVAEVKKKARSETAGAMADLLDAFVASETAYPGRAGHIKKVVAYLDRARTLKYRREDIESVCEFLNRLGTKPELMQKLVARGVKQHPDSVLLNFYTGLAEMSDGPCAFKLLRAQFSLEKAIKLAEGSTDPKETALLPAIKSTLAALQEFAGRGPGFGLDWRDGSFSDPDDEFDDGDDGDDGGWDEDGTDDSWAFGPPSPPTPRHKAPRKKNKSRKKR